MGITSPSNKHYTFSQRVHKKHKTFAGGFIRRTNHAATTTNTDIYEYAEYSSCLPVVVTMERTYIDLLLRQNAALSAGVVM